MSTTAVLLPGMLAHPSGALWLPETQTLLVADLHLGYSWAQRRRGELGPLADFETRDKLLGACAELGPSHVVFLGDLVHAPRPCEAERVYIEETISLLAQRMQITAVRGNHDRAFAREFGHLPLTTTEAWTDGGITAMHGDRLERSPVPETGCLILGHLHPCLSVREPSGATQKLPVFVAGARCVILPAFSPFARGYDVAAGFPPAFEFCLGRDAVRAYAAAPTRVIPLGLLASALAKLAAVGDGSPSRFRRFR